MNKIKFDEQDDFINRHIGLSDIDAKNMLKQIGVETMSELVSSVVPDTIYTTEPLPLADGLSEQNALAKLKNIAKENKQYNSFIGMGYYNTVTPAVILRNVLENPGWYTAYTPYQPEISQGRLEALLNYQQMVMDLTSMEIANASLLDEATAAAEAMIMALRVGKTKSNNFIVADDCHPQTISVLKTRADSLGINLIFDNPTNIDFWQQDSFGVLVQYPTTTGEIVDYSEMVKIASAKGSIVCVATDLLSLTLLKSPGEWGADIVLGSSQRFGVPLGFGGPHAAFFATRDKFKRSIPGRIVGVSTDSQGKQAFRLALQTREQHIRREKATSNICTAQVLLANIAGFYAVWHGAEGLTNIAKRISYFTTILMEAFKKSDIKVINKYAFDTLTIDMGSTNAAEAILEQANKSEINLRDFNDGRIGISIDETTNIDVLSKLCLIISGQELKDISTSALPSELLRKSEFLTHPVFNKYRSETNMMRYLHRLEEKDISLNRSMIPLGSCTMKLNAAAEMLPITWPEFSNIHPFAPSNQTKGYSKLTSELEDMLAKITGFHAVSLQPNAGSQGEYAGLLVIRAYHLSNGDKERNICLIPSSAHGTNPASAIMAGMKVVVVACDKNGNIDIEDLKLKAEQYRTSLAALMVTYPSTHGVFEEGIVNICDIIHENGGQVYMDGANLNALVGVALPEQFGADVAHLNLHKTFCIPHGGGGPGIGPIGVAKHLAPFLPGHDCVENVGGDKAISAISAAPWGSAGILPITWMYITMMGGKSLRKATEVAILNANYMARKLSEHYDILYTGKSGFVAHECILDTRRFHTEIGVSVEDIAKRLMDFGFHAPTISFPVVHTMMIEPTESESKDEIDRFIEAMITIRQEIANVENGIWSDDNNPLHYAPHTISDMMNDDWNRPYSKEQAVFPANYVIEDKYWPPVGRIDNAAGDRSFICSCPSIDEYEANDSTQDAA